MFKGDILLSIMNTRKPVAALAAILLVALALSACPPLDDGTPSIEMVRIAGGKFKMGSPPDEQNRRNDETLHEVTLTSFRIGKYEVTQAQYQSVMGSLPNSLTTGTYDYGRGDNYPVYYVNWYDTIVFCNKLSIRDGFTPAYSIKGSTDPSSWGAAPNTQTYAWDAAQIVPHSTGYRLPTEAQWEYACLAGTVTAYNTGATISEATGWYRDNSGKKTHEVGKKPPNKWGLYDMHGNVREWCWDFYDSITYIREGAAGPDPAYTRIDAHKVERGGSYDSGGSGLRSAYRSYINHHSRNMWTGFRLALPD